MALDKKGLFAAMELKTETVKIPGGEVSLREVGSVEYLDIWDHPNVKNEKGDTDMAKFTALLITRCLIDAKGERLLADEDVDSLRAGSTKIYLQLAAAARRLNGLSGEAGNSEPDQSASLVSA